jgi:hypothetical protein
LSGTTGHLTADYERAETPYLVLNQPRANKAAIAHVTAGRRAVITGPSCRWQRGEPGFRSPRRNDRYSGKLFQWLPVGLSALSFKIGTWL